MPKLSLLTPIIPFQTRKAWPKHADAKPVSYLPLHVALTRPFSTDAHFAAYAMPSHPYRLSSGAVGHLELPDCVCMVRAIFDIDGHQQPDVERWWSTERPKVIALRRQHPDLFVYRTRGGYRAVDLLPEPIMLCTSADVEAWRQRYLTWVAYLARGFAIQADPACKDWTRLFRLPHGTREPLSPPENYEVIGDARQLGTWAPEITSADVKRAVTLGKRPSARATRVRVSGGTTAGEGLLYHAFAGRGWIGHAIEPDKWAVACPWEDTHTMGERFDSSTVLWAPGPGDEVGWWHCSHSHCQHRDLRDVLRLFTPSALDRARQAAGIADYDDSAKGGGQHAREWRTARALRRQREAEDIAQRTLTRREGMIG
jgi:hypothetical protein